MNIVLRIVVCCLLIAGYAHAQNPGCLGIYGDPSGTDCNLYDETIGMVQYYVVHQATPGAQASRFKAPVPDCMNGAIWISDETMWPIKIGIAPDGTLVGYGGCVASPILVMTINIFGQGFSSDCCEYPILPAPDAATGEIEVEGCDAVWRATWGVSGWVNPTPLCYCDIPVEHTTWGKVKELYAR